MPDRLRRRVTLSVAFEAMGRGADGWSTVPCVGCREPLSLHQPDDELPSRLIAACGECRRWYLVECSAESPQALLVELPDPRALRGLRRLPPTG